MSLFIEPHAGVSPILQVIQSARHELNVGVYYMTDRPILRAIHAAKARGVEVRVIIEGKPYGMKPWRVQKEEQEIEATGATLHLAPYRFTSHRDHYAFYHAKYVCSGHECEIGTDNFDWSAFHRNREYLYVTKNPTVVKAANTVFQADWTAAQGTAAQGVTAAQGGNQRAPAWTHQVLVLSVPINLYKAVQRIYPHTVDRFCICNSCLLTLSCAGGETIKIIPPFHDKCPIRRLVSDKIHRIILQQHRSFALFIPHFV